MLGLIVAGLKWDPTIRGILFPGIMVVILCGSSYVILSTNVGNRLGFLIANAGFWAWMMLMSLVWIIYGIGPKGNPAVWHPVEVVQNLQVAQDKSVPELDTDVKKGWRPVKEGSSTRGDAQAAIDAYLGEAGAKIFPKSSYYEYGPIYDHGGDQILKVRPKLLPAEPKLNAKNEPVLNAAGKAELSKRHWYNPKDYKMMGLLHGRRILVAEVMPYKVDATGSLALDPTTKKPVIDTARKPYYAVMVRDLGTLRLRSFKIFVFSLVLLILTTYSLHRRDKQVMRVMSGAKPARA